MKSTIQAILTALVIISFTLNCYAQDSKVEIGVEGGVNLLFLRGNDLTESSDPSPGFKTGLKFQYNLSERTSLRTGLHYERKATSWDFKFADEAGELLDVELTEQFDYLTIPLLFRLHFGEQRRIFVNAGPYFGLLLRNATKATGPDSEGYETIALFNGNSFSHMDYGISAGFGINFLTINSMNFSAEVRNDFGVHNIANSFEPGDTDVFTNSPSALVSVMLEL